MSIMQIGELVGGLSSEFRTNHSMLWGPMKAMRNYVVHQYARVDIQTIWDTALNDIPALLAFCNGILAREET